MSTTETSNLEPRDSITPDNLAIDLRTAVMRTSRRLRVEATGDVITPGQYTVLAQLNANGPQTLRTLAEREHVQAPSMTRIVNALTEQGFVTRTAHPNDGISGTRMSRTFDGTCVKTIVLIRPVRAASRDATSAEIA